MLIKFVDCFTTIQTEEFIPISLMGHLNGCCMFAVSGAIFVSVTKVVFVVLATLC